MAIFDDQPPVGALAVFSAPWLRYEPAPGHSRYHEGYLGRLTGWWNGNPEFTIDAHTAAALTATFEAMADYVAGHWRTVSFDGHTLTVTCPPSLGGGVHLVEPKAGRYRIGWGLPWHPVAAACCDRIPASR